MTKRLSEIEGEPIVGKYYLVPCVRFRGNVCPVLGNEHNDAEYIGVDVQHYHYDVRFLTDKRIERIVFQMHRSSFSRNSKTEQSAMTAIIPYSDPMGEIKMLCTRSMPEFPILTSTGKPVFWVPRLEEAYKDKQLNCGRCPHRGLPVSAALADAEGNTVCPGHGLKFNIESGKLVSRLK